MKSYPDARSGVVFGKHFLKQRHSTSVCQKFGTSTWRKKMHPIGPLTKKGAQPQTLRRFFVFTKTPLKVLFDNDGKLPLFPFYGLHH